MSTKNQKDANEINQNDIDQLIRLYFKQPNTLYTHLFSSFHQLIEEIIPYSLNKENNYFYESIDNNTIYLHGFKCSNIRIKPPTNPSNNEMLSPKEARTKHLKYFATIIADVVQFVEKEDMVTGDKSQIYNLARKSYLVAEDSESSNFYDMIHTENFVLVDSKRRIRGFYDGTDSESMNQLIDDVYVLKNEL